MSTINPHSCPRCQIGRLTLKVAPYINVEHGLFISIPDVKTYECDVCGFREVDEVALLQLDTLVDDGSVSEPENRSAAKLTSVDADAPDKVKPTPRLK